MIVFSKKLRAKLRNYFRFPRFDGGQIIRIAPNGSKARPTIQQASDSNAKEAALAVEEGVPDGYCSDFRGTPPCEEAGRTPSGGPDCTCHKVPEYSAESTPVLCAEYCGGLRTATPHSVRMLRMGFSRATWRHWNQTVSSVMPPIKTKATRKSHQWMGVL